MQAALPFAVPGLALPDAAGPAAPTSSAALDDPAEWAAFGQAIDGDALQGRWASQVVVEGMHCAACAFTVEAALAQVPGVLRA